LKKHRRLGVRLIAAVSALAIVAAACGDDDDEPGGSGSTSDIGQETTTTLDNTQLQVGGEIVDLGTFVGDPPEHIDPALNVTLDAYQVVNALYDGLTDIDTSDPANPKIVPHVAESYEANDDATVWTFTIRDGVEFSNGEQVLPSSFVRAWERASNPDFAGDYSYLFNFIKGGAEKLAGDAETIAGVTADDEAMTLTVELSSPYSTFDAIAGFQLFLPMPSAVDELDDQSEWENGLMIGNGPFKLEKPRTDEEIVLVRNDGWAGDANGDTTVTLDKVTFRTSADPDSAYNAFEAGEGDTANIPSGRVSEAEDNYATTLDVGILGVYYFELKQTDPVVGGEENVDLRRAISLAVNRDEINEAVYENTRQNATGVTPPGIPGFKEGLCEYCIYDQARAQELFDGWKADGNEITEPIKVQFNAGAGHEDVVAIIVDNLDAIGIPAVATPIDGETYFTQLAEGACQFCRSGWFADYPTYDNFSYDLFHSDAIGGNNHGEHNNPEYDELIDEAKATTDPAKSAELFQQAETMLLNDDVTVIPINWYKGDYVYNPEKISSFPQNNFGLIAWERVTVTDAG